MNRFYRILIGFGIVIMLVILPITERAFAAPIFITQISAKKFFVSGVEKTQRGELEDAIKDFTQAIAFNPDFASAYSNRCLVNIQLGNYQYATEDCSQVLQLNPNIADS